MIKKVRELGFSIILIFLIAVGIYWIMEQLQKDYLDQYINILGDKLLAMVPESSEKEALTDLFGQFRTQVENKEISPEQVEKVAQDIYNLSNISDSVSFAEASALIRVPDLKKIPEPQPDDYKRWRKLERRLETVYKFEEKAKYIDKLQYQVDGELNIIVDSKIRPMLTKEQHQQIGVDLENLEKNKVLIWTNSLDSTIKVRQIQLVKVRHDSIMRDSEKIREFQDILIMQMDSMHNILSIDLDSLSIRIEHQLEAADVKKE